MIPGNPKTNTDKIPRAKELKAEYERSDLLRSIMLPEPEPLRSLAGELQLALAQEDKKEVQKSANAIAKVFNQTFEIPNSPVRVLGVRPREVTESSTYELYGDYDPETLKIRLWMRTAVLQKPSAFGTFLSTLAHELCHHLDIVHLDLPNSYHTRGFYERAGLLYHHMRDTAVRQLVWTRYADGTYGINWALTMRR